MKIYNICIKSVMTLTIISLLAGLSGCSDDQPELTPKVEPKVDNKIVPNKVDNNPSNLQQVISGLSHSESQALVKLISPLIDVDDQEEVIQMPKFFPITEKLKELIMQAENALRMNLPDDEKLAAIENLDGINSPEILDAILAALEEPNSKVREAALDAIMDINDGAVIPSVMKALNDEDPELRVYALDALLDVDTPEMGSVFLKALDDENVDVREAAVDLMLFIESPNILNGLSKALDDTNEDIRDQALITLEDIPDVRSVDILLQKGVLSENETIREDALDSIEWITDQEFDGYQDARAWWDKNRDTFQFED